MHKGGFSGTLGLLGGGRAGFRVFLSQHMLLHMLPQREVLLIFLGPVKFIYILSLMNPLPGGNGAIQKCLHKELCRHGHVIALFSLFVGLAHAKDCICSLDGNV